MEEPEMTKARAWMETAEALNGNLQIEVADDQYMDLAYYVGRMLLFLFRVMMCSPICEHARALQYYFGKGTAFDGKNSIANDTYYQYLQRCALVTHMAGGTVNDTTMLAKLRACVHSSKAQAAVESWIVSNPGSSLANLAGYMDELARKDNEPNLLKQGMEKALQNYAAQNTEPRGLAAGNANPLGRNAGMKSSYPPASRAAGMPSSAPTRNFVPRAARTSPPMVAANVVEPSVTVKDDVVIERAAEVNEEEAAIAAAAVAARARKPADADTVCDNCSGKGHYAYDCPRPVDMDKLTKARAARAAAYVPRPPVRNDVSRESANPRAGGAPVRKDDSKAEAKGSRPPRAAYYAEEAYEDELVDCFPVPSVLFAAEASDETESDSSPSAELAGAAVSENESENVEVPPPASPTARQLEYKATVHEQQNQLREFINILISDYHRGRVYANKAGYGNRYPLLLLGQCALGEARQYGMAPADWLEAGELTQCLYEFTTLCLSDMIDRGLLNRIRAWERDVLRADSDTRSEYVTDWVSWMSSRVSYHLLWQYVNFLRQYVSAVVWEFHDAKDSSVGRYRRPRYSIQQNTFGKVLGDSSLTESLVTYHLLPSAESQKYGNHYSERELNPDIVEAATIIPPVPSSYTRRIEYNWSPIIESDPDERDVALYERERAMYGTPDYEVPGYMNRPRSRSPSASCPLGVRALNCAPTDSPDDTQDPSLDLVLTADASPALAAESNPIIVGLERSSLITESFVPTADASPALAAVQSTTYVAVSRGVNTVPFSPIPAELARSSFAADPPPQKQPRTGTVASPNAGYLNPLNTPELTEVAGPSSARPLGEGLEVSLSAAVQEMELDPSDQVPNFIPVDYSHDLCLTLLKFDNPQYVIDRMTVYPDVSKPQPSAYMEFMLVSDAVWVTTISSFNTRILPTATAVQHGLTLIPVAVADLCKKIRGLEGSIDHDLKLYKEFKHPRASTLPELVQLITLAVQLVEYPQSLSARGEFTAALAPYVTPGPLDLSRLYQSFSSVSPIHPLTHSFVALPVQPNCVPFPQPSDGSSPTKTVDMSASSQESSFSEVALEKAESYPISDKEYPISCEEDPILDKGYPISDQNDPISLPLCPIFSSECPVLTGNDPAPVISGPTVAIAAAIQSYTLLANVQAFASAHKINLNVISQTADPLPFQILDPPKIGLEVPILDTLLPSMPKPMPTWLAQLPGDTTSGKEAAQKLGPQGAVISIKLVAEEAVSSKIGNKIGYEDPNPTVPTMAGVDQPTTPTSDPVTVSQSFVLPNPGHSQASAGGATDSRGLEPDLMINSTAAYPEFIPVSNVEACVTPTDPVAEPVLVQHDVPLGGESRPDVRNPLDSVAEPASVVAADINEALDSLFDVKRMAPPVSKNLPSIVGHDFNFYERILCELVPEFSALMFVLPLVRKLALYHAQVGEPLSDEEKGQFLDHSSGIVLLREFFLHIDPGSSKGWKQLRRMTTVCFTALVTSRAVGPNLWIDQFRTVITRLIELYGTRERSNVYNRPQISQRMFESLALTGVIEAEWFTDRGRLSAWHRHVVEKGFQARSITTAAAEVYFLYRKKGQDEYGDQHHRYPEIVSVAELALSYLEAGTRLPVDAGPSSIEPLKHSLSRTLHALTQKDFTEEAKAECVRLYEIMFLASHFQGFEPVYATIDPALLRREPEIRVPHTPSPTHPSLCYPIDEPESPATPSAAVPHLFDVNVPSVDQKCSPVPPLSGEGSSAGVQQFCDLLIYAPPQTVPVFTLPVNSLEPMLQYVNQYAEHCSFIFKPLLQSCLVFLKVHCCKSTVTLLEYFHLLQLLFQFHGGEGQPFSYVSQRVLTVLSQFAAYECPASDAAYSLASNWATANGYTLLRQTHQPTLLCQFEPISGSQPDLATTSAHMTMVDAQPSYTMVTMMPDLTLLDMTMSLEVVSSVLWQNHICPGPWAPVTPVPMLPLPPGLDAAQSPNSFWQPRARMPISTLGAVQFGTADPPPPGEAPTVAPMARRAKTGKIPRTPPRKPALMDPILTVPAAEADTFTAIQSKARYKRNFDGSVKIIEAVAIGPARHPVRLLSFTCNPFTEKILKYYRNGFTLYQRMHNEGRLPRPIAGASMTLYDAPLATERIPKPRTLPTGKHKKRFPPLKCPVIPQSSKWKYMCDIEDPNPEVPNPGSPMSMFCIDEVSDEEEQLCNAAQVLEKEHLIYPKSFAVLPLMAPKWPSPPHSSLNLVPATELGKHKPYSFGYYRALGYIPKDDPAADEDMPGEAAEREILRKRSPLLGTVVTPQTFDSLNLPSLDELRIHHEHLRAALKQAPAEQLITQPNTALLAKSAPSTSLFFTNTSSRAPQIRNEPHHYTPEEVTRAQHMRDERISVGTFFQDSYTTALFIQNPSTSEWVRPAKIILDPGASDVYITKRLAKAMGLKITKTGQKIIQPSGPMMSEGKTEPFKIQLARGLPADLRPAELTVCATILPDHVESLFDMLAGVTLLQKIHGQQDVPNRSLTYQPHAFTTGRMFPEVAIPLNHNLGSKIKDQLSLMTIQDEDKEPPAGGGEEEIKEQKPTGEKILPKSQKLKIRKPVSYFWTPNRKNPSLIFPKPAAASSVPLSTTGVTPNRKHILSAVKPIPVPPPPPKTTPVAPAVIVGNTVTPNPFAPTNRNESCHATVHPRAAVVVGVTQLFEVPCPSTKKSVNKASHRTAVTPRMVKAAKSLQGMRVNPKISPTLNKGKGKAVRCVASSMIHRADTYLEPPPGYTQHAEEAYRVSVVKMWNDRCRLSGLMSCRLRIDGTPVCKEEWEFCPCACGKPVALRINGIPFPMYSTTCRTTAARLFPHFSDDNDQPGTSQAQAVRASSASPPKPPEPAAEASPKPMSEGSPIPTFHPEPDPEIPHELLLDPCVFPDVNLPSEGSLPELVSDSDEDEYRGENVTPELSYPPYEDVRRPSPYEPPTGMVPYWLLPQDNPISYPKPFPGDGDYWNSHWNEYFSDQGTTRHPTVWGDVPQNREVPIEQPLERFYMGSNQTYWLPEKYADRVVAIGKQFDAAILHSRDYDAECRYEYHYNRYTLAFTRPTDTEYLKISLVPTAALAELRSQVRRNPDSGYLWHPSWFYDRNVHRQYCRNFESNHEVYPGHSMAFIPDPYQFLSDRLQNDGYQYTDGTVYGLAGSAVNRWRCIPQDRPSWTPWYSFTLTEPLGPHLTKAKELIPYYPPPLSPGEVRHCDDTDAAWYLAHACYFDSIVHIECRPNVHHWKQMEWLFSQQTPLWKVRWYMSFVSADLWEATRPRYTYTAQSLMHRRQVLLLGLSFDSVAEDTPTEYSIIPSYPLHVERYKENLVQCLMQPVNESEEPSDIYCLLVAQRMDFQAISLTHSQHALISDVVTALNLRKTRRIAAMFLRQRCIEHLQRDANIMRQNTPDITRYSMKGVPNRRIRETRNGPEWTKMYKAHEDFLMFNP
jgi:hypothetical protein